MKYSNKELLAAAEAFEAEIARWGLRINKAHKRPFEVFHFEGEYDEPVVYTRSKHHLYAETMMQNLSKVAAMQTALSELPVAGIK